jgi:hypothetical protein
MGRKRGREFALLVLAACCGFTLGPGTAAAGTVTFSATGFGGGYYSDPFAPGGVTWFNSNDITISASYMYDPTIQGSKGVFNVPTLVMSVFVPSYPAGFTVDDPVIASTISISKNEIYFAAEDLGANIGLWMNFRPGTFSPNSLPQSLDALDGQRGGFAANYYNHIPGFIEGSIGLPEPSSIVMLAIGVAGLAVAALAPRRRQRRHQARARSF